MNADVSDDSGASCYKGSKFTAYPFGLPMTASSPTRALMMMALALGLATIVPVLVLMTS